MVDEVKDKKKVGQEVETPAQQASESTDPYKEVFEEGEGKGVQTQTQVEEPADQRERSNLGRRVKRVEDKFDTFISKFESYLETQGQNRTPAYQSYPPAEEEEDEEFIRKMSSYERKKQNEQKTYEDKYLRAARQLGVGDPDFKEIYNLMMDEFNVRHSANPDLDAELNYSKAQTAFLRKQKTGNKPNVRSERTDASADLSVGTKMQTEQTVSPELDDYAREYISKTGMKDEVVKDALKGELRPGVRAKS